MNIVLKIRYSTYRSIGFELGWTGNRAPACRLMCVCVAAAHLRSSSCHSSGYFSCLRSS